MKQWILLSSLLLAHSASANPHHLNYQMIKNPVNSSRLKSGVGFQITPEQIQRAVAQAKTRHTNGLKKTR